VGATPVVSGAHHGGGTPAIVSLPEGMRVFFAGTPPDLTVPGGIFSAIAPPGGGSASGASAAAAPQRSSARSSAARRWGAWRSTKPASITATAPGYVAAKVRR
jgi:hypothetical protein